MVDLDRFGFAVRSRDLLLLAQRDRVPVQDQRFAIHRQGARFHLRNPIGVQRDDVDRQGAVRVDPHRFAIDAHRVDRRFLRSEREEVAVAPQDPDPRPGFVVAEERVFVPFDFHVLGFSVPHRVVFQRLVQQEREVERLPFDDFQRFFALPGDTEYPRFDECDRRLRGERACGDLVGELRGFAQDVGERAFAQRKLAARADPRHRAHDLASFRGGLEDFQPLAQYLARRPRAHGDRREFGV